MSARSPLHPRRSREGGVIVLFVAVLALIIIGLVGLAMDGAYISRTNYQLRHAADAAALNAVRYVTSETDPDFPQARAAAYDIAVANMAAKMDVHLDLNIANAPTGDVVVGHWDMFTKSFTPTLTNPNAVRVNANRSTTNADGPLALLFGPAFGASQTDVTVTSTAVYAPPPPPLILILDPHFNGALNINGTNSLFVPYGRIHANSDNACGIKLVGTPTMFAVKTTVTGGACYPAGTIQGGPVLEGQPIVPDPLAGVLPTAADWNTFKGSLALPLGPAGAITTAGTYGPGYYPGGLKLSSSDQVTLQPGSYMFGTEVTLGGSSFVMGTGVTIFIDKDVDLDISGSGAGMQLSPPGSSSPYFGITIFTHRQTAPSTKFKIGGGGLFRAEGVTYIPSGELVMGGIPGKEMGAIIAWRASTNGTTGFTITGLGIPPLTNEPPVAYLVE